MKTRSKRASRLEEKIKENELTIDLNIALTRLFIKIKNLIKIVQSLLKEKNKKRNKKCRVYNLKNTYQFINKDYIERFDFL